MVKEPIKKKKRPLTVRWGRLTAGALALTAFLGWYNDVQVNGRNFLCDAMKIIDLGDAFEMCLRSEKTS